MSEQQRYRVVERLESGGMAEVYRAEAESLAGFKKTVAIKRVLPHLASNKKFISMFLDEAKLSLHMTHANVVQVFDVGMSDETYFIVMEFVDGSNLKTMMDAMRKRGRLIPLPQAAHIIIECCRGLSYAHELTDNDNKPLHIVHRDVSPPNILLSKRGEVKVVDFGLAKATSQLEKTDPGVVKGKFSYLSPEAASGQEVDARADVFAAGIILWEMLAGRRLFLGESDYQTVQLVRAANVPSLSRLNPSVPADLEDLLARSMARDPAQRFGSAREFGDELAQFLFSHGLKVTGFDLAHLVQEIVTTTKKARPKDASIIDRLIEEELLRFTSLDDVTGGSSGDRPLSPEDIGSKPLEMGSLEDPRTWGDDLMESSIPPPRTISGTHHHAQPSLDQALEPPGSLSEEHDALAEQLEGGGGGQSVVTEAPRSSVRLLLIAIFVLLLAMGGIVFLVPGVLDSLKALLSP